MGMFCSEGYWIVRRRRQRSSARRRVRSWRAYEEAIGRKFKSLARAWRRQPAFRRPVADLAAFFAAGFFPSIGSSISLWPAETLRGFLPFGAAASLAKLFFRASMRSTTFSPFGRGLAAIVLPLRLALISSVSASS